MEEQKKISDVIKILVEQVSLKELSTRDFVKEMTDLYSKIDLLETSNQNQIERIQNITTDLNDAKTKLNQYEKEYVEPAKRLNEKRIELDYENRDWKLERKYVVAENENLKQILSQLLAGKTQNWYANGSSLNEYIDKPNLVKHSLEKTLTQESVQ